jgi:hypothetical protein
LFHKFATHCRSRAGAAIFIWREPFSKSNRGLLNSEDNEVVNFTRSPAPDNFAGLLAISPANPNRLAALADVQANPADRQTGGKTGAEKDREPLGNPSRPLRKMRQMDLAGKRAQISPG